jgi:heme/copper-type cytochrome/quinol oxidase subunit 2
MTAVYVIAALFYAIIAGTVIYAVKTLEVRVDNGEQVPPAVTNICLPDGQVDEAEVDALTIQFEWIVIVPNVKPALAAKTICPVVTANLDTNGVLTLAIGDDSQWQSESITNDFSCDTNGVPEFSSLGETTPGTPVNILYSPDGITWTNLTTINVTTAASYDDSSHPINQGNGFYTAWY